MKIQLAIRLMSNLTGKIVSKKHIYRVWSLNQIDKINNNGDLSLYIGSGYEMQFQLDLARRIKDGVEIDICNIKIFKDRVHLKDLSEISISNILVCYGNDWKTE